MIRKTTAAVPLLLLTLLSACVAGELVSETAGLEGDSGAPNSFADAGGGGSQPSADASSAIDAETTPPAFDSGVPPHQGGDAATAPPVDSGVDAVVHKDAGLPPVVDASPPPFDAGVDTGVVVPDASTTPTICIPPTDTASCTACSKQTKYPCQNNGCYNGYYCNIASGTGVCTAPGGC